MSKIIADLQESALNTVSHLFNKNGGTLVVVIRKDNLIIEGEYSSEEYTLLRFHRTTFGIKELEVMPPEIKFTIEAENYDVELIVSEQENSVLFREKVNNGNFISLKVI